jgi:hypothetical protein
LSNTSVNSNISILCKIVCDNCKRSI